MTIIEKTFTRFPERRYAQEELAEYLPRWVGGEKLRLAKQVFQRSAVAARHLVLTPEEMLAPGQTFATKNERYKGAIKEEIGALCDRILAGTTEEERASIDFLITASCTGFQIPAMDALVIPRLGLPCSLRRLNLTEHGCAAGAAALGLAHEWLSARPDRRALVVCSELCSLTFQGDDVSDENLVSAAIFGDGSAAALLAGAGAEARPAAAPRLRIRGTFREFFPETEHFMGFEVLDTGLKIKLSRDVVTFSQRALPSLFERACERWDVSSPTVFRTGSIHPGGRRILEIIEDLVGLPTAVTRTAWECLRDHGNMSSVSVLASLDRVLTRPQALEPGALGLISAFGPGFGAELGLVEVAAAA